MLIMEAVVADARIHLLGNPLDLTLVCVELQLPLPLPFLQFAKIILKYGLILFASYNPVK